MGYSKTSVCLAQFAKREVEIIYENFDPHCGVRDMDWIIY